MVNTCSLRGDWSTANLFTYRLTTQEPLFLPLPSHPPFIPCYLTFASLASSASRLPSSSPPPSTFFLPFLSLPKLPKSLPPIFSPMFLLLPPPTTLNCHSCPPPPLCLLLTNIYPLRHISPNTSFLPPPSITPSLSRLTRIGIRSVSVSFCGFRYFS